MKHASRWVILALLGLSQFMVVLDSSVANIALPAIQQSLNFDPAALQWVITAYALTFGGFLMLGGRAADLFGRRRVLLLGLVGFTLTSLLIGIAQTPVEMVAFRALQGAAAAFMTPSAFSIVLTTFREGKARNTALGIWTAVMSGGAAAGLVVGGLLTEYLNWRWNFFINIPIGVLVIIGILKYVPKHSSTLTHNHLDLRGAALVTTGLMALVYGLTEAPVWGWTSSNTIGVLAISAFLLAGFIWNEIKVSHPLVPLSIFKIRNVSGANAMSIPMMASMMGMFYLLSLYIQAVMKYSPVQTGVAFLAFPIVLAIASNITPRLIPRYGFKPFLLAGTSLIIAGMLWLSQITAESNYVVSILPSIIAMAAGMGMSFVSISIAATSGVPGHEAGLASGLLSTSQQMGGALGLAILVGVATSVIESSAHLGAIDAIIASDRAAFTVASVFSIIALILAIAVIRTPTATTNTEPPVTMH